LVVTFSLLGLAQVQIASAQTAPAIQQTVMQLKSLGQTTIHGGPVSSGAVALPEIQTRDDSTVGVKNQTSGIGPMAAAANAAQSFLNRRHGLAIPSKIAARDGAGADGASLFANNNSSQSAILPPPPTKIPNPKGSSVIDSSSTVFSFNGLTHFDQRVAGTGIYTNTQFSLEPPEQGLCAGGGFVVEAINNAIAVYDRSGNLLSGPEALSQFWGLAPEINRTTGVTGQFVSDPKCVYDRETQRWFVTELMQDTGTGGSGRNFNLIGVSQSSDPRGGFLILAYDVTNDGMNGTPNHPGCPCFGDQPLLGLDGFGIYQSTNEFGARVFNGAQVYAIPKKGLIDATHGDFSHLYLVSLDASQALVPFGGLSYSVQPAVGSGDEDQQDASGSGVEFFLSALQFGNPPYQVLDNRIAVWALGNTRSLTTSSPNLSLTFEVIPSETYGQPNPAQQKSGPIPLGVSLPEHESLEFINTNDDRMNQVVYANGTLYSGVNTIIGDGSRTGVAWFGVKPQFSHGAVSGKVVRQGYVAVDHETVMYPSLAFGGEDTGALVFTLVGPDYFPSAAFVKVGDDGTSAVHIAANGAAPDDGFSGYVFYSGGNVGRWGDYSAAVSDGDSVWLATEYIPNLPRTSLANWGTSIIKLRP
ncbi:MAG TPA: hypothetical protein VGD54_16455, partial [Steroidobacteraceae bacterium]